MARHKLQGKYCKEAKLKRLNNLSRARDARWDKQHASDSSTATRLTPISNYDHTYTCTDDLIVCQQTEIEQEADDQGKESDWRCGRRIVELVVLADGLKACHWCGSPLHLKECVGEKKFGLAHILLVKCCYSECGLVNDVPTGSRHKTSTCTSAWDVNTKLAAGLLAALNIPTITQKSLKSREREIATHLNDMVDQSCSKHLDEEIRLCDGDLTAGFDGAWQKRRTGLVYNSFTGHASLIGEKTKKCIGVSVMSKRCRICESARKRSITPRKHNCCHNWSGSAKSMEPAMACGMFQDVIDQDQRVQTLVMDNDSTTIARVKATVDPTIKKKSDSNHTRKGFTGSLIEPTKH
ncbi:uncharacterized protein LOC125673339 [Ostrea edulis]|uniref:uncharacterized protein LOC125673339 n=1 Tax=Ostrea edulis TaxID=37623 RepID=UPI0024AF0AD8|nr:uncharacterized protein LOC125673339 [Ostrea edulis]